MSDLSIPAVYYSTEPSAYLERLSRRLDEQANESLFYAALELRLGVEARMMQYLDPLEHIPLAQKKEWRIANLAKHIEAAFKSGEKIMHFSIYLPDQDESFALRYIPVSKKLQKIAASLGDYLHFPGEEKAQSAEWWYKLRSQLHHGHNWLKFACSGELIGMPLMHLPSKQVSLIAFFLDGDTRIDVVRKFLAGSEHAIHVAYEDMPEEPPKCLSSYD